MIPTASKPRITIFATHQRHLIAQLTEEEMDRDAHERSNGLEEVPDKYKYPVDEGPDDVDESLKYRKDALENTLASVSSRHTAYLDGVEQTGEEVCHDEY